MPAPCERRASDWLHFGRASERFGARRLLRFESLSSVGLTNDSRSPDASGRVISSRGSTARLRPYRAEVAQLVEHVTENHGVGSSILPLGTFKINNLQRPAKSKIAVGSLGHRETPVSELITPAGSQRTASQNWSAPSSRLVSFFLLAPIPTLEKFCPVLGLFFLGVGGPLKAYNPATASNVQHDGSDEGHCRRVVGVVSLGHRPVDGQRPDQPPTRPRGPVP